MYIHFLINTACTPEPNKILIPVDKRRTDVSPKTHALAFLMHCAGINRLFDKTCVEELLFRMALMLRSYNILDTFFKKDLLLGKKFLGSDYILTMNDLSAHLGLEISNSPSDFVNQDEWLKKYKVHWKNACLTCIFGDNPIVERISIPSGGDERKLMEIAIDLNDIRYNNNAAFFVTEVLHQMGNEPFDTLKTRIADRRTELDALNEKLNQKPELEFDYAKIPAKIKERFFELICGPVLKNISYFKEVCNDPTSNFAALMHLSWLWDNDFVAVYKVWHEKRYSYTAEVDPRIEFRYDYYDGLHNLEFGINLYLTYRDYNLEKLKGLLKEKK